VPLVEGEFVGDDECWIRVFLERDRTSSGRLHHSALKGRGAFTASVAKPWSHELSGRVVSVAGSEAEIVQHAEAFLDRVRQGFINAGKAVPSKIRLVGWICGPVKVLKEQFPNAVRSDVAFTPIAGGDQAHADLVAIDADHDSKLDPIRAHLLKVLRVVETSEAASLIADCGAAKAPNANQGNPAVAG
jgi:hypothetical protein